MKILFILLALYFSHNAIACELEAESYVVENFSSVSRNHCDGYRDCVHRPDLHEENAETIIYRVFVYRGNDGGYPSDDTYEVITNKSCEVIEAIKIN